MLASRAAMSTTRELSPAGSDVPADDPSTRTGVAALRAVAADVPAGAGVPPGLALPPALKAAPAPGARAGGRTPHPDSLAANTAGIRRGGRLFPHLPPVHARKHGKEENAVEVRVRTTILSLRSINLVEQTFTAQFFLEASWVDVGMVNEDGTLRQVDAASSDQKRGKLVTLDDKEHTFFTPQLQFGNRVNEELKLNEWFEVGRAGCPVEVTAPDGTRTERKAAVIYWRVIGCGVFQNAFDIRLFPFDSQTLVIKLLSDWDVRDVRLVRNMKHAYKSLVQDDAFMLKHEYELSRMLHMMTMQKSASNSSSGVTRATLHIELCIRRLPAYWFWNVSLPLFFFTGISFASFAVEVTALADRLSITITILLTLVAYRFAIVDRLPNVDHLTLLDLYIQLCFVVVVAITVHAVALAVRAESSLVQLTAPGAIWSVPDAWQGSQRVALWACSTAWIALNAAIYPCVWLSRRIAAWQPENLQWWDSVDDLLWVGGKPIGIWKLKAEKQTDLLSALQKAINAVIEDAEVVVPSRPDAAMMQPVVLLGVTFSSDELATLTTSKSGKIYHTAEAQQPRLSFTARQPSQPEPAIYGMPPRTKSRLYGRKLLPDSSGTCAVLQFDSALQAQHAQLAISEAVSLECVTCREKCRVEGSSVYIRRAAKLKDTAILAPADDWEQRLAELAKCLRHVDKPAACATCGRALQERAGATAPMSAADSLEDKERAKAAAAAEIVCEIALPEYKSLLKRHWWGAALRSEQRKPPGVGK